VGDEGARAESAVTAPATLSRPAGRDYVITDADQIGEGGPKAKFRNNLAAIRTLKELEAEGRLATPEEQAILSKYVGWGDTAFNAPFGYHYDADTYARARAEGQGWGREYDELRTVMGQEEFEEARLSRLNAHYTSPTVIRAMWDGLRRLGIGNLTRIRTLEPSAGIGNFFGLTPPDLAARSSRVAVDTDDLSVRILRQLYQSAAVHHIGYEQAPLPDGSFDLAISNVPFADIDIVVPAWQRKPNMRWLNKLSIHNQFFVKALEHVRPGGVVAFITSHTTMDATSRQRFREYVAEQADLLGAVRLPKTAFKQNAGTEVVTDIIFLRKRLPGEEPLDVAWAKSLPIGVSYHTYYVNEYFHQHPEMVLGTHSDQGSMRGANEYTVLPREDQDFAAALREAMERLPSGVVRQEQGPLQEGAGTAAPALVDTKSKPGAFVLGEDGVTIYQRDPLTNELGLATFKNPQTDKPRVRGMIRIADAAHEVARVQLEGLGEGAWREALKNLNDLYDKFTSKWGALHDRNNERLMRDDPNSQFLLSLERWDKNIEEALSEAAPTGGRKTRKLRVTLTDADRAILKGSLFTVQSVRPTEMVARVEKPDDALLITLNETARVDMDRIAQLLDVTPDEARERLRGLVYDDPQGGIVARDEYLSGDVRTKLRQAEYAAEGDAKYQENVEALRAVQPKDLEPSEISVRIGAAWLPPKVMADFFAHVTGASDYSIAHSVRYIGPTAEWQFPTHVYGDYALRTQQWGTEAMPAETLVYLVANGKEIKVYNPKDAQGHTTVNVEETNRAVAKAAALEEEFASWVWQDSERAAELADIYNETFNSTVLRQYDGSHLTLPGSNAQIRLMAHQKDAIWRALASGNTLLAHEVGAGKTFEMIAIGMEARRLGFAHKPLYVVPNGLLDQWRREFMALYPNATILVPAPDDFSPARRRQTFFKIQTGDWDAVILPQSQFVRLAPHPRTAAKMIQEQIAELEQVLLELSGANDRKTQKQITNSIAKLESRLTKTQEELAGIQDDAVYWDDLGVDMLFVDEADMYKNLGFSSKMERIKGLSKTESQRAFDMYTKVREITDRTNGRGVVFGTGTPVSNTIAELWTMLRYLARPHLSEKGILAFDAWARSFASQSTSIEQTVTGGYRQVTRFASWQNAPELSKLFQSVADVVLSEDVPQLARLKPQLVGGKRVAVVVPSSQALRDYIASLEPRLEWVKKNAHDPDAMSLDNYLKIYGDARKAALDLRLANPSAEYDPDGKVAHLVENLYKHWLEDADDRGTQLVFCDLGTPKSAIDQQDSRAARADVSAIEDTGAEDTVDELRWTSTLYQDIRTRLIERGIPAEEIAFIHDAKTPAQRGALFQAMNEGAVRILLGSTEKMGAGMNVQQRLHAIHHLDTPWRPRDVEQREGRILRQGNAVYGPQMDADGNIVGPGRGVYIYQYLTEDSFDSYTWQQVESKWRAIKAMMKRNVTERNVDEPDDDVLDATAFKAIASGNMLALERAKWKNDIAQLTSQRGQWIDQQVRATKALADAPGLVESLGTQIAALEEDIALRDRAGTKFALTLGEETFTKRPEAGKALEALVRERIGAWRHGRALTEARDEAVGSYAGFALHLTFDPRRGSGGFVLHSADSGGAYAATRMTADELLGASGTGMVQRIGNVLSGLDARVDMLRARITQIEKEAETWRGVLGEPFRKDALLQRKKIELERIEKALADGQKTLPDFSDLDSLAESDAVPEPVRERPAVEARPDQPAYTPPKATPKEAPRGEVVTTDAGTYAPKPDELAKARRLQFAKPNRMLPVTLLGKAGWSDGCMADQGEPPAKYASMMETREPADLDRLLPVKPGQPVTILGSTTDKGEILGVLPDGTPVVMDARYWAYFAKKYPGAQFVANDQSEPQYGGGSGIDRVIVRVDGVPVGILMLKVGRLEGALDRFAVEAERPAEVVVQEEPVAVERAAEPEPVRVETHYDAENIHGEADETTMISGHTVRRGGEDVLKPDVEVPTTEWMGLDPDGKFALLRDRLPAAMQSRVAAHRKNLDALQRRLQAALAARTTTARGRLTAAEGRLGQAMTDSLGRRRAALTAAEERLQQADMGLASGRESVATQRAGQAATAETPRVEETATPETPVTPPMDAVPTAQELAPVERAIEEAAQEAAETGRVPEAVGTPTTTPPSSAPARTYSAHNSAHRVSADVDTAGNVTLRQGVTTVATFPLSEWPRKAAERIPFLESRIPASVQNKVPTGVWSNLINKAAKRAQAGAQPVTPQAGGGGMQPPVTPPTRPVAPSGPPSGPTGGQQAGGQQPPVQPPTGGQPPAPPAGGQPPVQPPTGGQPPVQPPAGQPGDDLLAFRRALQKKQRPRNLYDRIVTALLDRVAPLKRLEEGTGARPYSLARLVPGAWGRGEALDLREVQPVLKGLSAEDLKSLEEYMVIRRAEDLQAINPNALLPGGAKSPQAALASLKAELGAAKYAEIESVAAKFWGDGGLIDRLVLQPRLNAGLISQELYDALKQRWPHYIPYIRQGFDLDSPRVQATPEGNLTDNLLRWMQEEGSERSLNEPLAHLRAQVIQTQVAIARNETARAIIQGLEAIEKATGTKLIDRKNLIETDEYGVMSWFAGGDKQQAAVPIEYARVAKGLDADSVNGLMRILARTSAPLRTWATSKNPSFLVRNPIRDLVSAFFTEGITPFHHAYWEGWLAALSKNADWYKAADAGVFMSGLTEMPKTLKAMQNAKRFGGIRVESVADLPKAVWRLLNLPFDAVAKASEVSEQATRAAVYLKLKAQGLDDIEAAVRAREATVDFAKAGNAVKTANMVLPFLNAGIQGAEKTVRTIAKNPVKAIAKAGALALPSILFFLWNQRYESAEEIPDYEYYNNWVFVVGEGTEEQDPRYPGSAPKKFPIYVKVPKGPAGVLLTAPVEFGLRALWAQDDRSIVEQLGPALMYSMEGMSPVSLGTLENLIPPILATPVQIWQNKDFFTRREIVPQGEEGRPAEEQYGPETSDTAVALGQMFNVSPRYIDFAISDYLGGGGKTAAWLSDIVLGAVGYKADEAPGSAKRRPETTAEQVARVPLLSGLVGVKGTQSERVGYERLDKATEQARKEMYAIPEFRRLGKSVNAPGASVTIDGTPMELTPEQRMEILELATPLRADRIRELVASPDYQEMNDIQRNRAIDRVSNEVYDQVRDYVLAGMEATPGMEPFIPSRIREQYAEYEKIPAYTGILYNPKTGRYQVLSLTEQQADRIAYVRGVVSDMRATYKDMTGKTLDAKRALLYYAQWSGDIEGAMMSLIETRKNPQRDYYWEAHPELADYYRKTEPDDINILTDEPYVSPITKWAQAYV
jgi:N12 class adenine-specific DNA methylase/adenine-specific DNA methylase